MKETEKCKIIQDLLPNYIENLTDTVTNTYVENHIKNCSICERKLKDMNGTVKLEKIEDCKKIDAFRKVKNRYKLMTLTVVGIFFLIIVIVFYFNQNYQIYKNDENKLAIRRITFDKTKYSDDTYLIIRTKQLEGGTESGYSYTTIFITLNNNGICTNVRCKIDGYTTETINKMSDVIKSSGKNSPLSNLRVENQSIYYNDSNYNGISKEEIVEEFKRLRNH